MRQRSSHKRGVRDVFSVRLTACVLLIALVALSVGAQSGRRPPKRTEPAAPVQPPPPDATPPPQPPEPDKPKIPIHVGESTSGMGGSLYLHRTVTEACARRLMKSAGAQVSADDKWMTPGEASRRAKASKETYFLAIVVESTGYYDDRRTSAGARVEDEIVIDFSLFTPETGKLKAHGRVYGRPYPSTSGSPLPIPGSARVEYMLMQAGEDVADRVLRALDLTVPPT
ncbi:MAG TPA: hypothetical protein VJH03_23005 [Blastocatellia bacterium]|nr:hypothetical protein [Blastocatellia bacterium]